MRLLTTSLLIMVLIATVGLGWLFDSLVKQYNAGEQKDVNAVAVLEQLGSDLASTLNTLSIEQQLHFIEQWPNSSYSLDIINIKAQPLPVQLLTQVKQGTPLLLESSDTLALYYFLPESNQLLMLKSPLLLIDPSKESKNYIFTLLFYTALLIVFALWTYPLVRRLAALRQTAITFGEGNLQQRVKLNSLSYINSIEIEFNRMAQRIENLVSDVKLLSSAVSHDLRTPLARIRFGIDTLQEEDDPQLRQRYQQKIGDNVDEMTALVDTLLRYARLDQKMLELKRLPVDLAKLIQDSINAKNDASVSINFEITSLNHTVIGDEAYLSMVINNLLQNAINYGEKQVNVSLTSTTDHAIKIVVEDDGAGIPTDQYQKIFQPFVRANAHNTVKGHGIGLAIVKRIVDWHQGSVTIEQSSHLGGARFVVTLARFTD